MWIFPSHAGWNLGKEILHTFHVGDVALRETKHTERMHTCSPLIYFQPCHIFLFLFFSSVVYQITSILSFWQVCHDVIQPHSDILSPTLGCWWSVGKWYVFKSNCGKQKPETLAYSCIQVKCDKYTFSFSGGTLLWSEVGDVKGHQGCCSNFLWQKGSQLKKKKKKVHFRS